MFLQFTRNSATLELYVADKIAVAHVIEFYGRLDFTLTAYAPTRVPYNN